MTLPPAPPPHNHSSAAFSAFDSESEDNESEEEEEEESSSKTPGHYLELCLDWSCISCRPVSCEGYHIKGLCVLVMSYDMMSLSLI